MGKIEHKENYSRLAPENIGGLLHVRRILSFFLLIQEVIISLKKCLSASYL